MAKIEMLGPYVTDHLAGSTAGRDLARKIAADNEGTLFGSFMNGIAAEIEADRSTLEDLIDRLGVERHPVKEAVSWMAEKLSRLRLASTVTGSGGLSRLMELETLSMGIFGKLCLWQALGELSRNDPEPVLASFDFEMLAKRAQDQIDGLEPHRRAAATRAFGADATG